MNTLCIVTPDVQSLKILGQVFINYCIEYTHLPKVFSHTVSTSRWSLKKLQNRLELEEMLRISLFHARHSQITSLRSRVEEVRML